ncbi:oligosaccharide flippase family protein [Paenibacillus alkaliterrae]|uniref:oligosaccharide flippase family protein n=1 Tax=Paenibacillus alkaliterrae TaxID=320909 RepID=UPI001F3A8ADA|nr:oligosaccharide flippase family protein [Paenibacillus alkaliterrae]MCF2937931.1 oligosaccharide flippase family protein [Paenibacillus alkaliterrae]
MAQLAIRKILTGNGLVQTILRTSATNFMVMVITTLTSIVTARMFGVEGKGEFSAILFWPTFLVGIVGFGLPTSLIYNMKRHAGKGAEFIRAGFLFQLPVSITVGVISWIYLPVWLGNYPVDIIRIAQWYTVLTLPLLLAVNLIAALAQSTDSFKIYNGVRLFVPLFNLAGITVLFMIGVLDIQAASFIYLITTLLVVIWSLYQLRGELRINWFKRLVDRAAAKSLFGYGSRVFGVELLGTLYSQFDKIIILSLLTPRDFGLYSVVYALSRVFNAVQMAISNVIFPKLTGLDKDKIISTVGRAFRLSLILMTIVVVPSIFVGRFLMGILFGAEFLEASIAFYFLSIECILGGASWILATSFNALGRPGLVLVRQVIALAITILLFFVFTPLYGLNGIALALVIGAMVRMLITIAAMRVVFKVRFAGMLFDKDDFRFLIGRLREKNIIKRAGRAGGMDE